MHGFEELVAAPLERLAQRNIRTPALLTRLLPWRWTMPDGSTRALADQLADAVPWWSTPLRDNAVGGPTVITGATEIAYGVDWTFAGPSVEHPRGRVGDYRLGYAAPPPELRVADAIAASCAFPPYFEPMAFDGNVLRLAGGSHGNEDQQARDEIRGRIRLTDGGVYDNLALEPVWKNHATVLVSDGGSVFRARTERTVFGRLLRIMAISSGGGTSVRLRWLHASFARAALSGVTWSLDTKVPQSYPAATVELINAIRTDLDAFSRAERHVLERHGYLVADAAIHRHRAGAHPRPGSAAPAARRRGRPRRRRACPAPLGAADPLRPLVSRDAGPHTGCCGAARDNRPDASRRGHAGRGRRAAARRRRHGPLRCRAQHRVGHPRLPRPGRQAAGDPDDLRRVRRLGGQPPPLLGPQLRRLAPVRRAPVRTPATTRWPRCSGAACCAR